LGLKDSTPRGVIGEKPGSFLERQLGGTFNKLQFQRDPSSRINNNTSESQRNN
jgi:hypothetical protein